MRAGPRCRASISPTSRPNPSRTAFSPTSQEKFRSATIAPGFAAMALGKGIFSKMLGRDPGVKVGADGPAPARPLPRAARGKRPGRGGRTTTRGFAPPTDPGRTGGRPPERGRAGEIYPLRRQPPSDWVGRPA